MLAAALKKLAAERKCPILVALDGGSGAGKSTLAAQLKAELDAVVIPLDDFFSGNIPDHQWDEFTVAEKLANVFVWERLRRDVLAPLLDGRPAAWHAFDFQSVLQLDGTYKMETKPKIVRPAPIILLEGAYSSSPQLADLVDMAILVDVPMEERHARLAMREDPEFLKNWHKRWDEVERYYFEQVRPKESFDIVTK